MNLRQKSTAAETPAVDEPTYANTVVAATIDEPIEPGRNVVWCASFQAAWKRLQNDIVKEPVRLSGAEALVGALNQAPDPAADIPEEWLYAAAGWTQDGIIEQIGRELADRYPDKETPEFPGAYGLVAYAYLSAALNFPDPYLQNDEPLFFKDGNGELTAISSFGVRKQDAHKYQELRMQPQLLQTWKDEHGELEWALDLFWRSESVQLVVARIDPEPTLSATMDRVLPWSDTPLYPPAIDLKATMLVPDMDWTLEHRFSEIIGLTLVNPGLVAPPIGEAIQDIKFKLDRSGVQVKSDTKIRTLGHGEPTDFVLDGPFLLFMKMRQSKRPFLAMWVDNAELLKPFSAQDAQVALAKEPEWVSEFRNPEPAASEKTADNSRLTGLLNRLLGR